MNREDTQQRPERLLTPREAAKLLNVKLNTLYTWAQRGQVPVQHVNRCLRFSPSALERWLESQRCPAQWTDPRCRGDATRAGGPT